MNNLFRIFSLIFLISCESFLSQNIKSKSSNIQIDFAQFKGNIDGTLLEIYYSIPRTAIVYDKSEKGLVGEYKFTCSIFYENRLINTFEWGGTDIAKSETDILPTQTINNYHLLLLKPNNYRFKIDYTSASDEVIFTSENSLLIENFESDQLNLSSLQLCSAIERTDKENRFVKNGYKLTFNPSLVFGSNWPIIYHYSEIYNLSDLNEATDSTYSVYSVIKSTHGKVVKQNPEKHNIRIGNSVVNVGQIFIGNLNNGAYELELLVKDNATGDSTAELKKFYVFKPEDMVHDSKPTGEKGNILSATYIGFSEEELDKEFEYIKYISSSTQKESYEKLNLAGKREFFVKFWNEQNDKFRNPNKFYRDEYFNRIEFANNRYGSGLKEGWETNPGRVILVYGKPDELDKFTSQATMNQYEIWQYHNLQGGVQFVFVDISGYGDLRLVHSNAINEIQDYEWQQRYLQR